MESQRDQTAGELWGLLVTNGLNVESRRAFKEDDDAAREAERWARVLSRRAPARIERRFQDRWQVGDEWFRVVPSFLAEESREIWVGTYWGRDGVPIQKQNYSFTATRRDAGSESRWPEPSSLNSMKPRGRPGIACAETKERPRSTAPRL